MSADAFALDYKYTGHICTMLVLTLLMCGLCWFYSRTIKSTSSYDGMPKITFLMFMAIQWIKKNAYQIVGKSYKWAVPFFIYIISLFWFSNIISILGFDNIGSSLAVPVTLTFFVFIGTLLSGIIHRGYHFFGDYFIGLKFRGAKIIPIADPLKLIGEASKLLSLTFRLGGNTLAGSLILFIIYHFSQNLFSSASIDYLGPVLLPLFVFPLHIYFDIIGGTIQPMIFMLLTMCYWSLARHGEGASDKNYDVQPEDFLD